MLEKITKTSVKVNRRLCLYLSGSILVALGFLLVTDSFLRVIWGKPFGGSQEVAETILVWVVFASLAYALITGIHVRVILFVMYLPSRLRSGCEIFSNAVGFIGFAIFTWAGWRLFWVSLVEGRISMALLGLPLAIPSVFIPIGCALMSLQFLIQLVNCLKRLKHCSDSNQGGGGP